MKCALARVIVKQWNVFILSLTKWDNSKNKRLNINLNMNTQWYGETST